MTGYRLEYAPSARAKCKGPKPCAGSTINKGELRLGTLIDVRGMQSFAWRHWGCVTPKIFENLKNTFKEGSELDGYDQLNPEDQAKIDKAWQDGHVADDDIPPTARKPANEDGEEGKPKKAKRAPAKKKAAAESDGEAEERPKRKAVAKKTAVVEDAEDDEEEEEEEKPKKKRAPPKKKAEPKEKPAPKKRASKKKKEELDEESGEDFTKELDNVPAGSDEEEEPEVEKPKKTSKKPASKVTKPASTADVADGEEGSSKKRKRPASKVDKPASTTKKAKPVSKAKKSDNDSEVEE